MTKKERYKSILEYFEVSQPIAETELNYANAYELAVAVILSAQCTDKRVNMITPKLFETFPNPETLANAQVEEIFELIRSCSYPNNKAKHLSGMAKTLMSEFKGEMPSEVNDLQKLPGVGRKSANVIASVVFNKPAMAVDTHVSRVSQRLGLVDEKTKTPLAIEMELIKHIPENLIPKAHHWLILHGRYVCLARKPKCLECELTKWCKYFSKLNKK